jgi:hypothetical protein
MDIKKAHPHPGTSLEWKSIFSLLSFACWEGCAIIRKGGAIPKEPDFLGMRGTQKFGVKFSHMGAHMRRALESSGRPANPWAV